ncbi:MAG: hypothetical protein V3W41_04910 [Planctomycetota bacterium]
MVRPYDPKTAMDENPSLSPSVKDLGIWGIDRAFFAFTPLSDQSFPNQGDEKGSRPVLPFSEEQVSPGFMALRAG